MKLHQLALFFFVVGVATSKPAERRTLTVPGALILTEVSPEFRLYATVTGKSDSHEIKMLLGTNQTFELVLEGDAQNRTKDRIETRFYCEDDGRSTFDWKIPKNETNCRVVTLQPSFEYEFVLVHPNLDSPKNITLKALKPGKQQVVAYARWASGNQTADPINTQKAYLSLNVGRSSTIEDISKVIGWIYFIAWSISFYPQIIDNFRRKSVVGLNFDFMGLNLTGFLSYLVFNVSLYAIPRIQREFEEAHPRSQIPVEPNDVGFAAHAAFATLLCIVQCFLYERGTQVVSLFCKIFLGIVFLLYLVLGILTFTTTMLTLLNYIYVFSFVKLAITLIKYIPQAYYNYKRKSTIGWSIGNIFLDFTGGSFSMLQMFLNAYNYDDWSTIFTNFTKFGLGFISIMFDVLFILQHYVFYRHARLHDSQSSLLPGGARSGPPPHTDKSARAAGAAAQL